jgi:predicted regulator of Ras-like GTPase activity (Roadblock/LC7/MglB family)
MRSDQVMESQAELFETPFSQKADEDAKRFLVQEPALAKEMLKAAVLTGEKAEAEEIKPEAPKFDAKEAIAQASALDGVISCGVSFTDGLSVGGNISPELHLEGLSALAPTLLQKLEKHMLETQLGALRGLTIHGEKTPVSFFVSGNICLTAVHDGAELTAESRRELNRITEELSRTYAQPETVHVDH